MTLFRGRDDIYAKRWENKKGNTGYSPACRNEWKSGVCRKPQVKCSVCAHRSYDELTEQVIEDHLRGKVIVGIYSLCMDETCRFLAMDFDDEGWQRDVTTFRSVCLAFDIPVVVERSRSGDGAHAWFFFETPISAHLARKFGSALITCSMSRHHEISFKSYDRLLSATTAFGKTVIAAKLIAGRKVSTLILVHRQQLLAQWADRLAKFLKIDEVLPVIEKKRGRRKKQNVIGLIGAGKKSPGGIVDIAIMQSLSSGGDVKELVKDYGMVIVDECHHVPAFSFEQILKTVTAKYVYGLTATAARQDGHHPIIFMHCGPIRYRVDAKQQALLRPFEHYIIPKFTNFRLSFEMDEKDYSIQELYSEIVSNDWRNRLITDDVIKSYAEGRNCLVLTERTAHVEVLSKMLQGSIPDVISLTGSSSVKEKREAFIRIKETPTGQSLTLLATGKYIGEGFDEPRLDTLFLAMPISWKGTVQQYAGRLHRLFAGKENVRIYDYVDSQVRVFSKMYNKRLAGYASLGYKVRAEALADNSMDIIFDHQNFQPVYENDLANARKEIVIVSPFTTKRRLRQTLPFIAAALHKQINVVVVTRPVTDYKDDKTLQEVFAEMESMSPQIVFKSNIHQKFAIIDQRIVWYGSINLLGYGRSEESMMRLESANIACELMKSLE